MAGTPAINRINVEILATNPSLVAARDAYIQRFANLLGTTAIDNYRYSDTSSGLGIWKYIGIVYAYSTDGVLTIATVTCSGMAHPPSGSNVVAVADPGPGTTYTWYLQTLPIITTSSDSRGGGGGSTPTLNNNIWVWNIPGNSPTAAADFTTAINKLQTDMVVSSYWNYYKYVDSVSGAWSVYAVGGPLSNTSNVPTPLCCIVTCSGTPNPPTYSLQPAVSIPSFTQTFTSIGAPLALGPSR